MTRALLGLLFVVAVLLFYLPLAPGFPVDNLDSAWHYAMNEAIARHLVIGRDIVFTFGPFAPVYTRQYHPGTDAFGMAGNLLTGLAFAAGLLCLATNNRKWPLLFALTTLLTSVILDPLYLALPPLLLFVTARLATDRGGRSMLHRTWLTDVAQALLAASLGLLPLVKGSFGALSLVIGALSFLLQWQRSPSRALAGAVLFALTLSGGWIVTGQPLAALPHYFVSMQPIISGYTDAMSLSGRPADYPLFAVIAIILLRLSFLWVERHGKFVGYIVTVGLAISLFIAFKAGFVRHDAHAVIASGTILLIAIFVSFECKPSTAVVLVALALTAEYQTDNRYFDRHTLPTRVSNTLSAIRHVIGERLDGGNALRVQFDASIDSIRKTLPLPPTDGSWDAYPVSQSVPLANGVAWSPRPVFQSYSAYGAELARLNAAHLISDSGPANVLFGVSPIDQRLPAFDDSLSWLGLLGGYRLTGRAGPFLVLRRTAPVVRPAALIPFANMQTTLGERVALPASNDPLWLKIDLSPSLAGMAANTLLAIPEVHIEFTFEDGHMESYRYISSIGATGFLVSPFVRNTNDFATLLSSGGRAPDLARPVAMRIVPHARSDIFWSKQVPVQVSRVQIRDADSRK